MEKVQNISKTCLQSNTGQPRQNALKRDDLNLKLLMKIHCFGIDWAFG